MKRHAAFFPLKSNVRGSSFVLCGLSCSGFCFFFIFFRTYTGIPVRATNFYTVTAGTIIRYQVPVAAVCLRQKYVLVQQY